MQLHAVRECAMHAVILGPRHTVATRGRLWLATRHDARGC
jgi:hypothetical protein